MQETTQNLSRRSVLRLLGVAAGTVVALRVAPAAASGMLTNSYGEALPDGAQTLASLTQRLADAPRRRDFKSVPFMVDTPEFWDHEAAALILGYRGRPSQVWENSDIGAAWPGLMRESLNGQVFAHHNPDFLSVSATHGSAHLALFNQEMWDKYDLAEKTGGVATRNTFIVEKPGVVPTDDHENIAGFYGAMNNNIISLQRRGAVFVACHDSIHAISRGLQAKASKNADLIAADLTNNLIPGAVLVPSVVAFLAQLQRAGFTYAKGA
jgi:intracellular sulfur oxidation DsrE/DsrF family protein